MEFEHELCQAAIIKWTKKVLQVLTTKPLLETNKWNTKAIFKKNGMVAFY